MLLYLLHHLAQSVNVADPPPNTNCSELRPLRVSSLHGRDHVEQLLLSLRVEGPCKVACGQTCRRKEDEQKTDDISSPLTKIGNEKLPQKEKTFRMYYNKATGACYPGGGAACGTVGAER